MPNWQINAFFCVHSLYTWAQAFCGETASINCD